jgi:hypothetical protein
MDGINLQFYNYSLTTKRALIANNELIYQVGNVRGTGLYNNYVNADYLHNSFYMSSTGELNGLYLESVVNSRISIKNNNIVILSATSGDLFKYTGNTAMNQYDIDYNNFYTTRPNIGTFNGAQIPTVAQLLQNFPTAQHMVSVPVDYVDIDINSDVKVDNIGAISAPALPAVTQDMVGKTRTGQATMGAYQIVPYTLDLGINQFISLNTEVVKDQTVSIDIEVQNTGTTNIQNAVFGWSINGVQQTSIPWTPTTPLAFIGKENVSIGSFIVSNTDSYNIVVWLESLNNTTDMYHANDTIRIIVNRMPLAEWAAPFVEDTLYQLTFDVSAIIRTITGAPVAPPELTFITIVNEKYTLYDTLPMRLNSGVWQVSIPQQYYGSNVIYSLTVSDNEGYFDDYRFCIHQICGFWYNRSCFNHRNRN